MKSIACAALALLANGQVPQTPTTTAGVVAPVDPVPQVPIVPADPRFLTCTSTDCTGRVIEVTPAENFVLECIGPNSCAGSQIYFNVGYDPRRPARAVSNIEELIFEGAGSGEGANVHLINSLFAEGHTVELQDLICETAGSCTGLTVYVGEGIDFTAALVECVVPGSCDGCTVHAGGSIQPCGVPAIVQPGVPAQPGFPGAVPPNMQPPAAPVQPVQPVYPGAVYPNDPVQPAPVEPQPPVFPGAVPPNIPAQPAQPAPQEPVNPVPVQPANPQPPAQGFPQFPGFQPPQFV